MPIAYRVHDDIGIVEMTFSGQVTAADFQEYFRQTLDDPRVTPDMHRLADTRQITGFPDSNDVRDVGRVLRDRPLSPTVRFAVIAVSELGTGVAMMMAGYAGFGDRIQVFNDEATAMLWLVGKR